MECYGKFVAAVIAFLLVTLIPSALSYSTGAPTAACSTLTPNHGSGEAISILPYRIDSDVFRDTDSGELLYTPGYTYNGKLLDDSFDNNHYTVAWYVMC